jgi:uncharacterized protein
MAEFVIHAKDQGGAEARFTYNNHTSELTYEDGSSVYPSPEQPWSIGHSFPVSAENPSGKVTPRVLKISLGLMCNFECTYCSQRFVPRNTDTGLGKVQEFLDGLDAWVTEPPTRIEFWGGEPFAYIKVMKPLAERLREKWPDTEFLVITNGSLLNPEINAWLDEMGFSVGVSHDGPAQHVRGPDPLKDQTMRLGVFDLYRRLAPQGRISFNAMVHDGNPSRAAIQQHFFDIFGPAVNIGEGSFIDAYDAGGKEKSLKSNRSSVDFRTRAIQEALTGQVDAFGLRHQKVDDFINSLSTRRDAFSLGQKCGMDRKDTIAVDLNGDVLTCQNVSAVSTAPNGKSHKIGNVSDFHNIKLKTATHWSHRPECVNCPVLQLCKGGCMFLQGDLWNVTCNNAYSDNVVWFSLAFLTATGFFPYRIEGDELPDIRQWLWEEPKRSLEVTHNERAVAPE